MSTSNTEFPLVSVLFITYKRFDYLQRAVESFRRNTSYPRIETVIADDGSGPEIQEKIRSLGADRYAFAEKNRGLGANNNAGLRLCRGKYVLMIQEDCLCFGPPEYLTQAVKVMEANPDVGIINFSGAQPNLAMVLKGSDELCFFVTPGLGREEYLYTDQPHLRSMESIRIVGYYSEQRDMERCEMDYALRWKAQTQFKIAVFPAYYRKVYRHDDTAPSFRLGKFRHRSLATLLPIAQWLKWRCWPVYRAGRAVFYSVVRVLEELRVVK
jgi:glycosyltransferase involved in cell wall biosynthesis